jgi:hypothetical protein
VPFGMKGAERVDLKSFVSRILTPILLPRDFYRRVVRYHDLAAKRTSHLVGTRRVARAGFLESSYARALPHHRGLCAVHDSWPRVLYM